MSNLVIMDPTRYKILQILSQSSVTRCALSLSMSFPREVETTLYRKLCEMEKEGFVIKRGSNGCR